MTFKETPGPRQKERTVLVGTQVGDIKSKYKFKKKLGQGGFDTVYLCHLRTDVKPSYNYYAVKSIRNDKVEN